MNDARLEVRDELPQPPERPQQRSLREAEREKLLPGDRKERIAGEQRDDSVVRLRAAGRNKARQYPLGATLLHGGDEGGRRRALWRLPIHRKNSLKQPHAK